MSFCLRNDAGDVVRDIVDAYDKGEIEGVIVLMKKADETWTQVAGMTYIERLGALEVIKDDMKAIAVGKGDEA